MKGKKQRKKTPTLGSKLSVRINKTMPQNIVLTGEAKNEFRLGYVTIFHPEAARLIAQHLESAPQGRLFRRSRSQLDRLWRQSVFPVFGVTCHDMRRASALWLGRTMRLAPTLVQEHLRHAELETTMLYCREPRVDFDDRENSGDQGLDDVV